MQPTPPAPPAAQDQTAATTQSPPLQDWYPLESSPEVLTSLARHWGLPDSYAFVDVLGLDDDTLALTPRPVHAVVFLFPDTDGIVAWRAKDAYLSAEIGAEPLWIPQRGVGHSCGTFAVLHALAETRLASGLDGFFAECRSLTPEGRTALLATSPLIKPVHNSLVTAGQTILRESDWADADHFISFIRHDGRVVEMDGARPRVGGVDRGAASDDLLTDVAKIVREQYVPLAADSVHHFSLIALVSNS
ncbi:Ubiquitin carboxyl-terminal hydrolase 3 [Vanrija pseudolonga]|uniref:Ubiquitin carboxyl-terminal hydrolase n=1 Tax=Vanrija pseudolonga TaxID=143232 RepID=A0AAF0YGP8_9TREE|nr:Ubiquitin carboxyl-terminal hydrolase 3 [Vanrija pseudolonga]